MTAPTWPAAAGPQDPPVITGPWWPRTTEPITVPVKPCCGLLAGDVCDCADLLAEMVAAFASPIRWHVTPDGVEAQR